jgi:EAL domain-containing protein (putative c-di-GMP-specific phosphodiesterase class I)
MEASRWRQPGRPGPRIAISVSPRQFQDPHLVADVVAALSRSGLDPTRLKIEVTESILVGDMRAVGERLRELVALGITVALDDFGTGYSSLRYLQRLPFHLVKIDRSFIEHIDTDSSDLTLVRTISRLGHELHWQTLAEGIETARQEQIATALGIDYAQGFHYSKPLPAEQIRTYQADRSPHISAVSNSARMLAPGRNS